MKLYHLERTQKIGKPIGEVFPFFEQPENLKRITPPTLGFEILTPSPIKMQFGALIDYKVRIMGFKRRWTTMIAEYDPPHKFVDVQVLGPYSYWHHTHCFEPDGNGTRMLDHVRYIMPLGYLGRWVNHLYVRRELERIFDYRKRVIEDIFA